METQTLPWRTQFRSKSSSLGSVVMEEAQVAVGTHRRDPKQTILIGGGRQEGRRGKQEPAPQEPRGWASDVCWKFPRSLGSQGRLLSTGMLEAGRPVRILTEKLIWGEEGG